MARKSVFDNVRKKLKNKPTPSYSRDIEDTSEFANVRRKLSTGQGENRATSYLTPAQMGSRDVPARTTPTTFTTTKYGESTKPLVPFSSATQSQRQQMVAQPFLGLAQQSQHLVEQRQAREAEQKRATEEAQRKYDADHPIPNIPVFKQYVQAMRALERTPILRPFQQLAKEVTPDQPLIGEAAGTPTQREQYVQMQRARGIELEPVSPNAYEKGSQLFGKLGSYVYSPAGVGTGFGEVEKAITPIANRLGGAVASKSAEKFASLAPNVAKKISPALVGRIGELATKGALIGGVQGAQAAAIRGETTVPELLREAGLGALGGGVLGGSIPAIGAGLRGSATRIADKYVGTKIGDALSRFRTPQEQKLLALPPGRGDVRMQQARQRANIEPGTEPIVAEGRISPIPINQPLALPPSQFQRKILKPVSNSKALDRVMSEIKPIVTERMTPPLENPNELAKWVKNHFGEGISLNEIRQLPYDDLVEMADMMHGRLNVADEAIRAASERGFNLNDLLEGNTPNISKKLQEDAQKRVYGVYPSELPNVQRPKSFARTVPSEALLRQELRTNRGGSVFDNARAKIAERRAVQTPSETPVISPRSVEDVTPTETLENNIAQPVTTPRIRGERGFMQTLEQSGKLTPETETGLRESAKRTYEPITNTATVQKANERIIKNIDAAESYVLNSKKATAEHIATGMRLIDEFQRSGNVEKAVTLAEKISKQLTEAGQTVQAASIWSRLTPEGALLAASRMANKAGKELDKADASNITTFAQALQRSGESVERAGNVQELAAKLKRNEKLTDIELHELTNFVEDARSMLKPTKPRQSVKPPKLPSDKKIREQIMNNLNDKEAQLMEFINKNKNRFSSTPLDIWGAYAALGAIKIAKGSISFSRWSEEMLQVAGESIRPHLVNLFDRSAKEVEQLERLLPDKSAAEKVAQKYIDAEKLTNKDADLIHDLATRMGKMNTKDKQLASRQMQEILNKYEKSSVADKINAVRYIHMLANTTTQLTNIISSPLMYLEGTLLNMIQTPFDVARASLKGTPRQVTFKQGPKVWDNFFEPVKDYYEGLKIGGSAGWKGIDPNGITTQNDVRGLAFKSKFNPYHWIEKSLGAVMKGADYASYNAAAQTKMRQLAYLDALNKGIKGDDAIRQYMDRYLNNIDDNIAELADKYGKEITFQQDTPITRGAQSAVRGLNKVSTLGKSDKIGIGNALLPFVKTPTNILMSGLERTPAGILKGIYELSTMAKNPDISTRQIMNTFTKALAGTGGLTGTGYLLGELGIITGDSSSSSKDVQALEQDIGKGKFKFNTSAFGRMMGALVSGNISDIENASKYQEGDNQLNYNRLQPFAFPISMGATFAEQQRQAQAAEERGGEIPLSEQVGKSLASAGQSLFDMSLLKGLQDAFDVQPGEGISGTAKRIGQSYAKSFSPSLLAQEARREDEDQRQVAFKGLTAPVSEYYQSRLPGVSKQLPPKVTTLGQTKKNEPGIIANYLNPLQSIKPQYNKASQIIYDVIQKTGDELLAPTPLDKNIRGKNAERVSTTVTIPQRRYIEAQQRVGQEISKRIIDLPINNLSPEDAATAIEKIYREERAKEREKLKVEFGLHYK